MEDKTETIDAQIERLETELAQLKRQRTERNGLRFKVGDKVLITGTVDELDSDDIPYKVSIDAVDDYHWFCDEDLKPAT